MDFLIRVLVAMLAMAVIDLPVIAYVIAPTIRKHAGGLLADKPDLVAAGIFYVLYVSLVVFLTMKLASNAKEAAGYGAVLGLFAYGTYELTNKAVLRDWPWESVAVDVVWGTILTGAVALIAYVVR